MPAIFLCAFFIVLACVLFLGLFEMSQASSPSDSGLAAASPWRQLWKGVLQMMPLNLAVIPWGIIAGTYAVDAGLSLWEGQAMSALLFAGAAQLVVAGMMKAGAGLGSMMLATLFITSRHFLYGLSMRDRIGALPAKWRLPLGFLLTDELFAIIGRSQAHKFLPWYAFGAGFSFYMVWNVATFVGLVAGTEIPHLDAYGLEFAVAAMFIAIVTPLMRAFPVCGAVVAALVTAVLTTLYAVQGGLVIASCVGMATGYVLETLKLKRQQRSASGAQSALLGKNEHDGEAV